jgi:hypothetical protein
LTADREQKVLTEDERAVAELYIAESARRLAKLHVVLEPVGSVVAIDGRPLEQHDEGNNTPTFLAGTREPAPGEPTRARRFTVLLDPGPHAVAVRGDGESRIVDLQLTAGETRALQLNLTRDVEAKERATAVQPVSTRASQADRGVDARMIGAIGFGVLGAGGVIAGGVLAERARSLWSDARAACPDRDVCPDDRGYELSNASRDHANGATLALGLGVAALAAAGVFTISVALDDAGDDQVALLLGTGRIGVSGRF